jgi:PPOX class probable FMN-dependent enzyme
MDYVENTAELEAIYGTPGTASLRKVARRMTPLYRAWIMRSRLCLVSTVGPEGTDGSPRGDEGPVVLELDPGTLAMPDWRGNNRMDSLRNIVADGRMSLMFLVPGSNTVVRVNGTGQVTLDDDLCARFERKGRLPRSVIVMKINEIYTQCARALMRSETWSAGDQSEGLPSAGEILAEQTDGEEGGTRYDEEWGARAVETMW